MAAQGGASGEQREQFSASARRVLTLAQEEARRRGHRYVGTGHLLLGLLDEEGGHAARVLMDVGVSPAVVRSQVEASLGHQRSPRSGALGLTPTVQAVLALAAEEAQRRQQPAIGPAHLLLGVLRQGDGLAVGVLASEGGTLARVRAQLSRGGAADQDTV